MITQGPFSLTLGVELHLPDPGATSNNPSVALQLQNSSPYIISVLSGGQIFTIQSFTAQTIQTQSGIPVQVTPIASIAVVNTFSSLIVVWLLKGESPPMADGPLTAAAIAAASVPPTGGASSAAASGSVTTVLTHSSGTSRFRLNNMWLSNITNAGTNTTIASIIATIGGISTDLLFVIAGQIVSPSTFSAPAFASTDGGGVLTDAGTDVTLASSTNGSARCGIFYSIAAT